MAKTVRVDQLANELTNLIRTYTTEVERGIEKELDNASKELVKDIKAASPRDTGEYASGWTRKKLTNGGEISYIIHNRKRGSIAHLLEFGHAKVGGGRVSARPHIRPVYDRLAPGLERKIKVIIESGGKL